MRFLIITNFVKKRHEQILTWMYKRIKRNKNSGCALYSPPGSCRTIVPLYKWQRGHDQWHPPCHQMVQPDKREMVLSLCDLRPQRSAPEKRKKLIVLHRFVGSCTGAILQVHRNARANKLLITRDNINHNYPWCWQEKNYVEGTSSGSGGFRGTLQAYRHSWVSHRRDASSSVSRISVGVDTL